MKVLFINVPCRENKPAATIPLGIAYTGSVLRNAGHEVKVLDIDAYRYSREKVEELIAKEDFDIAATGGLITVFKYMKWLSALVKKLHPKKFLVIGGAMPTSAPEIVLGRTMADAIILGEGEQTTLELVETLEKKGDLGKVNGIWFKKGKSIVKNPPRELIKNLDELPFPAWDLFPMELYLKRPILDHVPQHLKSLSISTRRGCPYNCTFCYNVFGARTTRARSNESIIAEIKELQKRYDVRVLHFNDDLFVADKKKAMDFCDMLIKEKIDLVWATSGRANLVDLELLQKMKQAGCVGILYGFESGSQKILDKMQKMVTVEQMRNAVKITKQAGLKIYLAFMVGIPGESPETIKETVKFIKENDLYVPSIFITCPFPGSQLYDYAKKKGLIKNEEKFIENCGEALGLQINLTDMSDKELVKWRDWAVKEVVSSYRKRHPLQALKLDWQKLMHTIKNVGIIGTAKKIVGRAKRRFH